MLLPYSVFFYVYVWLSFSLICCHRVLCVLIYSKYNCLDIGLCLNRRNFITSPRTQRMRQLFLYESSVGWIKLHHVIFYVAFMNIGSTSPVIQKIFFPGNLKGLSSLQSRIGSSSFINKITQVFVASLWLKPLNNC